MTNRYSGDRLSLVRPADPPMKTVMPKRKRRSEVLRNFFALGPVPLSVAAAAGRAGPWCLPVLLAVRAWSDMTKRSPAAATWIAAALGTNIRSVQRAISSLIAVGMVVRHEDGVTIPSWSKLHRQVSGKG